MTSDPCVQSKRQAEQCSKQLSLLPLQAPALLVLRFRCVALYAARVAAAAMRTEDPDVAVSMHGGTECLVGHIQDTWKLKQSKVKGER